MSTGLGLCPAGVVLDDAEAERFELVHEVFQAAVVIEPGLVVVELFLAEQPDNGLAGQFPGPGAEGAVEAGWLGVTGAVSLASAPSAPPVTRTHWASATELQRPKLGKDSHLLIDVTARRTAGSALGSAAPGRSPQAGSENTSTLGP